MRNAAERERNCEALQISPLVRAVESVPGYVPKGGAGKSIIADVFALTERTSAANPVNPSFTWFRSPR